MDEMIWSYVPVQHQGVGLLTLCQMEDGGQIKATKEVDLDCIAKNLTKSNEQFFCF